MYVQYLLAWLAEANISEIECMIHDRRYFIVMPPYRLSIYYFMAACPVWVIDYLWTDCGLP